MTNVVFVDMGHKVHEKLQGFPLDNHNYNLWLQEVAQYLENNEMPPFELFKKFCAKNGLPSPFLLSSWP